MAGSGRDRLGAKLAKKPHTITRIGSGRDSPDATRDETEFARAHTLTGVSLFQTMAGVRRPRLSGSSSGKPTTIGRLAATLAVFRAHF